MANGKFEIYKGKNGQFYVRLKAANGQNILSGEGYKQKAGAQNGIKSIKNNAVNETRYDIREASNGKPYFVLKAGNGEPIGRSQFYSSRSGLRKGMRSVMNNAPKAEVKDLTKDD